MAGTRHSEKTKQEVLRLGKAGKTYSQIQERFPIPKSTLSVWFKNAGRKPDRTRQLEHLKRARIIAAETIKKAKVLRILEATARAQLSVGKINYSDLELQKFLLAMLYWAEGSKTIPGLKFTNTDPVLIKMYLTMVRACYSIDEKRIKIGLHIHHYHEPNEVLNFWSNLLDIPVSQFWKIHVKKRSTQKRFRQNFRGICFVYYPSAAIQREILALGKLIAQGIETDMLSSFNG